MNTKLEDAIEVLGCVVEETPSHTPFTRKTGDNSFTIFLPEKGGHPRLSMAMELANAMLRLGFGTDAEAWSDTPVGSEHVYSGVVEDPEVYEFALQLLMPEEEYAAKLEELDGGHKFSDTGKIAKHFDVPFYAASHRKRMEGRK